MSVSGSGEVRSEVGAAFVTLYEQLRRMARARLAGMEGVSLQATAVVHEALLRLSERPAGSFVDEQHVLAAVSQVMRCVIVDHLRARRAAKRNGGATRRLSELGEGGEALLGGGVGVGSGGVLVGGGDPGREGLALDIDAALGELSELSPETRVIVELHVFGGIPLVEVAALTGSSERTVRRKWAFATALLREKLEAWGGGEGREPDGGRRDDGAR